jgi:hypothetical protein
MRVTAPARRLALGLTLAFGFARPGPAQGFAPPGLQQQAVQLTALGGWGFGGSVRDTALDESRSFEAAPVFGAALDLRIGQGWNLEFLYSRQNSRLGGGLSPSLDVALERYLVGLQEEKGDAHVRWFGTFWLGATRFDPGLGGFDAETKFAGGIGLGVKAFFAKNVGLRLEARGFYTVVKGEAGVFCSGGACLFSFSGSSLWQGDVGGGLILAF